MYVCIFKGITSPPKKNIFEISLFSNFSPKKTTNFQKFATKIKQKILLIKGQGRVIQLLNSKISPNYVCFISIKVKCIATLLKYIYINNMLGFFSKLCN